MTPFSEDVLEAIQDECPEGEGKTEWLAFFKKARFFDFISDGSTIAERTTQIMLGNEASPFPIMPPDGHYWLETSGPTGAGRIGFACHVEGATLAAAVVGQHSDGVIGLMPVWINLIYHRTNPVFIPKVQDDSAFCPHPAIMVCLALLHEKLTTALGLEAAHEE